MRRPDETHQCANLPDSIRVERGSGYFADADHWVLVISRSATEQDLEENQHLEEIGQDLWSTVLEVSHCPYCGLYLGAIQTVDANTAHYDYSSWNAIQR